MNSAKILLVLGLVAQIVTALLGLLGPDGLGLVNLLGAKWSAILFSVATSVRAIVYTAGDLLDDGKKNDSFRG
jgi:hypothetical protein